jgi:hypothetical protein
MRLQREDAEDFFSCAEKIEAGTRNSRNLRNLGD